MEHSELLLRLANEGPTEALATAVLKDTCTAAMAHMIRVHLELCIEDADGDDLIERAATMLALETLVGRSADGRARAASAIKALLTPAGDNLSPPADRERTARLLAEARAVGATPVPTAPATLPR